MSKSSSFLTCATCSETRRIREHRNEEHATAWLQSLAPAKRLGEILTPLMQQWRINIDFREPGHIRLEPDKVILLVPYATQKNRLRQIASRLESAIASAGLGITAFDIHILPPESPETPAPKVFVPRGRSTVGAADLALLAQQLPEGRFKEKAQALSSVLSPEEDTPDVLAAAQLDLVRGRYQLVRDQLFEAKTALMVAMTDAQAVDERFIYFPEQAKESVKALEAHRVFEERLKETQARIDALRDPWERLEALRQEGNPEVITKTLAALPEAASFAPPPVHLAVRQHSAAGAESLREVSSAVQSAKLHRTLEALAQAVDAPDDVKVEKLRFTLMARQLETSHPELKDEYERLLQRLGKSTRHYEEVLRKMNALEEQRTPTVSLPQRDPRERSVAGAQALEAVLESLSSDDLKAHFEALKTELTPAHASALETCLNQLQMRMQDEARLGSLTDRARTAYLTKLSALRIALLSGTAVDDIKTRLSALEDECFTPAGASHSAPAVAPQEAPSPQQEESPLARRLAFLEKLRAEAPEEKSEPVAQASPRPYSERGSALLEEASHEAGMSEGLRDKLARLAKAVKDGH